MITQCEVELDRIKYRLEKKGASPERRRLDDLKLEFEKVVEGFRAQALLRDMEQSEFDAEIVRQNYDERGPFPPFYIGRAPQLRRRPPGALRRPA